MIDLGLKENDWKQNQDKVIQALKNNHYQIEEKQVKTKHREKRIWTFCYKTEQGLTNYLKKNNLTLIDRTEPKQEKSNNETLDFDDFIKNSPFYDLSTDDLKAIIKADKTNPRLEEIQEVLNYKTGKKTKKRITLF